MLSLRQLSLQSLRIGSPSRIVYGLYLNLRRFSDVSQNRKVNTKNLRLSDHSLRRTSPSKQHETANEILALLNKKQENKGTESVETTEKYLSPVTSITVGESIDLSRINTNLQGKYAQRIIIPNEVLNVNFGTTDLMILSNGTVVGWGLTEQKICEDFFPLIQDAVINRYEPESEEMDWIDLGEEQTGLKQLHSYMKGEVMIIQERDEYKKLIDKAAFAVGFSRSTRLSILENALEKHIQLTRSTSEALAIGKDIALTEKDVLRLTGRLFLLRGKLNLYSELIETPDLYWSEPNLEKIYDSISKNLDISSRISILNRKLDYATEEQRALLSVLNEKKSTRLEWIIIILIMVEVCFETIHFYEKYSENYHEKSK